MGRDFGPGGEREGEYTTEGKKGRVCYGSRVGRSTGFLVGDGRTVADGAVCAERAQFNWIGNRSLSQPVVPLIYGKCIMQGGPQTAIELPPSNARAPHRWLFTEITSLRAPPLLLPLYTSAPH